MKIYNTYSRQLEDFQPIEPGKVKMYVCGPTVYNYIHVGNARSVVAFDLVENIWNFEDLKFNISLISQMSMIKLSTVQKLQT